MNRLRRLFPVLFLLLAVLPAGAHRTVVDQVTLLQLGENRYGIRYDAPPPGLSTFGAPVLPDRASWVNPEDARITETSTSLVFETTGGPLTADDRIVLPWRGNGVLVEARWLDGRRGRQFFTAGNEGIVIELASLQAGSGSWGAASRRYFRLGCFHILSGVEHLLFVAGLLLLVKGTKRLVLTLTAFTLAHSIALAFAVLGWLTLPPRGVEAVIAMSLVLIAVEILRARRGAPGLATRKPWLVAFLFGLIHGVGFSGALEQLGLTRAEIPPALLFFNLGIEAGQLAFIALLLLLALPLRRFHDDVPRPLRFAPYYLLGILGSYWTLDRALGIIMG